MKAKQKKIDEKNDEIGKMIPRCVCETAIELYSKVNDPGILLIGFIIVLTIGVYLLSKWDSRF